MKARFNSGTDVAMLGVWDAERDNRLFTTQPVDAQRAALDDDARAGHIFLVHTHADGGGPVDAYVDEPVPDVIKARLTPLEGEYLLAVPSGALIIDGAETYRTGTPDEKRKRQVAVVPPGDYAVRCYQNADEEAPPRSEGDLIKLVGREDVAYYDRMTNGGCVGGALTLLLFPILLFFVRWPIALVITAVVFFGFFHGWVWFLRRNPRYARLDAIIPAFRLGHEDPTFVFELRRLDDRGGLVGGSVSL